MATPEEQAQTMRRNLEEKTGRPMEHWLQQVADSGLEKHGVIVKMLKSEHGLTHGYANLVAHEALASAAVHTDDEDLVAGQYSGKEGLRPIHDRIVQAVQSFGADVEVAPKKSYVSLRRRRQFALIQPSTKARVDLGIQLRDVDPDGRLEASGSFNSMVSHRVRITDENEVDDEVLAWLRQSYDAAG